MTFSKFLMADSIDREKEAKNQTYFDVSSIDRYSQSTFILCLIIVECDYVPINQVHIP